MAKTTQGTAVANHMRKYGSITSMEAFELYGITRLADVVFRLKKQGYEIKSEPIQTTNRYGTECRYSKYSLVEDGTA